MGRGEEGEQGEDYWVGWGWGVIGDDAIVGYCGKRDRDGVILLCGTVRIVWNK